jgi:phenylacetic acid degradation protein paaN
MSHPLFEKHRALLEQALATLAERGCWAPYPESPRAYGEEAIEAGQRAFEAYLGAQFYLDQPGLAGRGGVETSPFGQPLDIAYPLCTVEALVAAGRAAMPAWVRADVQTRAGVCVEILARLHAASAEIAHAVMHTTGLPFAQAFAFGGPQAQERGLQAVVVAYREMLHLPSATFAETGPIHRWERRFSLAPKGVALTIASAYAPTWSAYPALFASLATGNPVLVKPHWGAVLPLAITVAVARQVLKEAGFDPNLVSLLADLPDAPVTRVAALRPEVRLIDYAGGPDFGAWLEDNARQAMLFRQRSGVNCVVVDSTADYPAMLKALAIALCLHSGQLNTSPRVIFVAGEGVRTPEGVVDADRFGRDLAMAVGRLLDDPQRAVEVLGAVRSPATLSRLAAAAGSGEVLRESAALTHPQWPAACVRSPLLVKVSGGDTATWMEESLGPLVFLVAPPTTAEALALAERAMAERGAANFVVYTASEPLQRMAEEAALRLGVPLTLNLSDGLLLTQPCCVAADSAFVAARFAVVQSRRPLP